MGKNAVNAETAGMRAFQRAMNHYNSGSFDRIFPPLKQAVYHLLRCDRPDDLARAYNLFAVEAQRRGCLDVACHYFHTARLFAAHDRASLICAAIDANTGDLLMEMGNAKEALPWIRRSLPAFRRAYKNNSEENDWLLELINSGLCAIYADDMAGVMRTEKQLDAALLKCGTNVPEQVRKFDLLFRAQISLVRGDNRQTAQLTQQIVDRIILQPASGMYAKDTYRFCNRLIDAGKRTLSAKLITALEGQPESNASTYAKLLLKNLQVDYYHSCGDTKRLLQACQLRNELFLKQQEDEILIYSISMDLQQIADTLFTEQHRVRKENMQLREKAETDALTRLPNRYGLNRAMEEAFHRAVSGQMPFGIGVIDIDNFKQFNDSKGHKAGDDCLVQVADALRALSEQESLFCARYGGDEFVLIYENRTDAFIRRLEKQMLQALPVSVTHGFYNTRPTKETMMWSLFTNADRMLYDRKRNQRNEWISRPVTNKPAH